MAANNSYPPPAAMDEGFSGQPTELVATGSEVIYRAFGGTSQRLSNCFFVPQVGGQTISYWTAELFERELNASLWGNDFEVVRKYLIVKGVPYKIGDIAHDSYVGHDSFDYRETKSPFVQKSWVTPSGIFKQVVLVLGGAHGDLAQCVCEQKPEIRIRAGRYARATAAQAKKHRQ